MAKLTTTPVVNGTALVRTLSGRGRDYTRTRNVVIAHLLFTGVKASVIVEESGVDKGDVSRINKALTTLKGAKPTTREGKAYKAITTLVLRDLNVDSFATLESVAPLGVWFERTKNVTGASAGAAKGKGQGTVVESASTVSKAGEGESSDMQALIFDFLVNAPDYTAALVIVTAALESAERAVAERAAEADAA